MIGFLNSLRVKMNMFRLESKYVLTISFLLIVISCNYEEKKLENKRNQILTFNKDFVGTKDYYALYNKVCDSINNWKKHKLGLYSYFDNIVKYEVDSILCFNMNKDKVKMTMLRQISNSEVDDILFFYGAKVEGEWLFFEGATMILLRKNYQKDIHTPIPFEKMKLLATKYIYSGYLIQDAKGNWIIDDRFFKGFNQYNEIFGTYGGCKDCKTEDEFYLHCVQKNWE